MYGIIIVLQIHLWKEVLTFLLHLDSEMQGLSEALIRMVLILGIKYK